MYDQIIELLDPKKSQVEINTGLHGLLALASRYEHEDNNHVRLPFYSITEVIFGRLELILNNLMNKLQNPEAL